MKKALLLIIVLAFVACKKDEPKGVDYIPRMNFETPSWLQGTWYFDENKQSNENDLIVINSDISTRNGKLSVRKEIDEVKATGSNWFYQNETASEFKYYYIIPTTEKYRSRVDYNGNSTDESRIFYYKTTYSLTNNNLSVEREPLDNKLHSIPDISIVKTVVKYFK